MWDLMENADVPIYMNVVLKMAFEINFIDTILTHSHQGVSFGSLRVHQGFTFGLAG
jgi:hypothetical protein